MQPVAFEPLLSLPRVRVGAAGPVLLSVFDGLGDMEGVLRVQRAALSLARKRRSTIGSLVVVGDGKTIVNGGDSQQRAEFQKALKEVDAVMFATAVVVASGGFSGAALRAFVSGVILAARSPYPMKVFDGFVSARDWIVDRGVDPTERTVVAAALDRGLASLTAAT
ncbi:MAG: hypothetical protein JNK05_12670 [Myxococcales bacterium]|nr:hypothetical protein [Myxococcales bacterium]